MNRTTSLDQLSLRSTSPAELFPSSSCHAAMSYSGAVFKVIVAPLVDEHQYPPDPFGELLRLELGPCPGRSWQTTALAINDQGAWVHPYAQGSLSWTPQCRGGVEPLDHPALPFPFSAGQLAAFMLYGAGVFIREYWWSPGRDIAGPAAHQATRAREALRAAHVAYRAAERFVGTRIDHDELVGQRRRLESETDAEYEERVGPINQALQAQANETDSERVVREEAEERWREEMVNQLLQVDPTEPVRSPARAVQVTKQRLDALLLWLRENIGDPMTLQPEKTGKRGRKSVAKNHFVGCGWTDANFTHAWDGYLALVREHRGITNS